MCMHRRPLTLPVMDAFHARKASVLAELASSERDKSRKGGVDAPIASLIESINEHEGFFTTSSCSGRISLFLEPDPAVRQSTKKKGGEWLLVSHDTVGEQEVLDAVSAYREGQKGGGLLHFRFEPFILAVECRSAQHAQQLVHCAIGAGFRESGQSATPSPASECTTTIALILDEGCP
eukprot:jgi/Mesen1/171/ME1133575C07572